MKKIGGEDDCKIDERVNIEWYEWYVVDINEEDTGDWIQWMYTKVGNPE